MAEKGNLDEENRQVNTFEDEQDKDKPYQQAKKAGFFKKRGAKKSKAA
eukprot:CAMPEP_0170452216 /NCGR_PEP_ID=MMETSP0123-20130129/1191_1 /TAXON_ID=182087 /ORGANISM="Favella ehrenbergii, Strain Fehren 1" /LENGTH=47 /DNA_ID= /DNA_START= /DNA_END= /DNA_ORIENTATION=